MKGNINIGLIFTAIFYKVNIVWKRFESISNSNGNSNVKGYRGGMSNNNNNNLFGMDIAKKYMNMGLAYAEMGKRWNKNIANYLLLLVTHKNNHKLPKSLTTV